MEGCSKMVQGMLSERECRGGCQHATRASGLPNEQVMRRAEMLPRRCARQHRRRLMSAVAPSGRLRPAPPGLGPARRRPWRTPWPAGCRCCHGRGASPSPPPCPGMLQGRPREAGRGGCVGRCSGHGSEAHSSKGRRTMRLLRRLAPASSGSPCLLRHAGTGRVR